MTHEVVLAALPNSEAEAKSLKDIAEVLAWRYLHTLIGSDQSAGLQEF